MLFRQLSAMGGGVIVNRANCSDRILDIFICNNRSVEALLGTTKCRC